MRPLEVQTGSRVSNPARWSRLIQDAANERRRTLLQGTSVNRPFEFASHSDDDFSSGVSLFKIPDCLGDLGERVRPVDNRGDLPGFDELLENDQILVVLLVDERAQLLSHERR